MLGRLVRRKRHAQQFEPGDGLSRHCTCEPEGSTATIRCATRCFERELRVFHKSWVR